MAQLALLIDHELCFDCKACEVACKQENTLPVGPKWINVDMVGPRRVGEDIRVDFIPTTCHHCGKPPCADVCPTEAIKKREDGIVIIDPDLCIGCMACLPACPFAVIQFNSDNNTAEKCNLCLSRIQRGLKPACAHHCEAGAILFGDINKISQQMRKERAHRRSI